MTDATVGLEPEVGEDSLERHREGPLVEHEGPVSVEREVGIDDEAVRDRRPDAVKTLPFR